MTFVLQFVANRDEVILTNLDYFRRQGRAWLRTQPTGRIAIDAEEEAVVAGIEAIAKWERSKANGGRFRTFATAYIRNTLRRKNLEQLGGKDRNEIHDGDLIHRDSHGEQSVDDLQFDAPELKWLSEPARSIVRLSLSGIGTRQIGIQLGIPAKQVAFFIRQAAQIIQRERKKKSGPSLFDGA